MFPTWRGRYTRLLVTFVQTEERGKGRKEGAEEMITKRGN